MVTTLAQSAQIRYAPIAWNALAYIIPKMILLFAGLYVARRWGHEAFAHFSISAVTLSLVGTLPGSALGATLSKYVSEFSVGSAVVSGRGFAAMLGVALVMSIALGVVVLALAPTLARVFALDYGMTELLRMTAAATAACVLSTATSGLLAGGLDFRRVASANVLGAVAFASVVVPLGSRAGVVGIVAGLSLFYFISTIVSLSALRSRVLADWRRRQGGQLRTRITSLFRYFTPMLLAAGAITPVTWLCNAILSRGVQGLVEVARFGAGYNCFAAVTAVTAVLGQVEFVRISKVWSSGSEPDILRALGNLIVHNLAIMAPIVVAGVMYTSVLAGLYRMNDSATHECIQLLLVSALVASIGSSAGLFFAAVNRVWTASLLNVAWGITTLASAWWLKDSGATGIAKAFLIGYTLYSSLAIAISLREFRYGAKPGRRT